MKYSIAIIKDMARRIGTPIIYFWGHHPGANKITATCMSQWYECRFVVDGVQYHTAEQYMMAAACLATIWHGKPLWKHPIRRNIKNGAER